MDTIVLNNLELWCIIGERPDERFRKQRLDLNIELEADLHAAATSDNLQDTVDYAALAHNIRQAIKAAECRLIERAAEIVASVCLQDKRVHKVRVSVRKTGSVPHLESAEVRIERESK